MNSRSAPAVCTAPCRRASPSASARAPPSLTLLALDRNQITDEGCAALASSLRSGALPSLVTLAVDKGSTTPYRGRQPSVARMRSRECSRRGLGSRGFDTSGALPSKIAILNSEHTWNGLLNEGGTLTEKPAELFLLMLLSFSRSCVDALAPWAERQDVR